MSTGKGKQKRELGGWKECLACNVIIHVQDTSDLQTGHDCPVILNDLEERLIYNPSNVFSTRLKKAELEMVSRKLVTPRKLFEENIQTPDKNLNGSVASPSQSKTRSKLKGFCIKNKLFGVYSSLAIKDIKNVPPSLQSDLLYMHPSTMRVCGIGIGDYVLLTSRLVSPRLAYAWPFPTNHPASISHQDKAYSNCELIKVELYPLPVRPATNVIVELLSAEEEQFEDKLVQVLKVHMCNRTVTQGSEFSVNFYGRPVLVRVKTVSGDGETTEDPLKIDEAQKLLESFAEKCSLEDSPCETEEPRETQSPVSPVSGFKNAANAQRTEVLKSAMKESFPEFYKVSRSTKVMIENKSKTRTNRKKKREVSYQDIGGLDNVIMSIRETFNFVFKACTTQSVYGVSVPKGVILFGPPGTGKTLLAHAIRDAEDVNFVSLSGPDIFSKYFGETESKLKQLFEEAIEKGPSIIFLDDVDVLCPKQEHSTEQGKRFLNALLQLIDNIQPGSESVFLLAATNRLDMVDLSVRRPGRLDTLIEVPVPTPSSRVQILSKLLSGVNHNLSSDDVKRIGENAHSFTGGDLAVMVRDAVLCCLKRPVGSQMLTAEELNRFAKCVRPSAMKEVTLEVPKVYWSDIAGQKDLKLKLRQSVEWPLKHPEAFRRLGINPPHGLLMFGPPGCSKTLIAKALATESGLNFLAIKGPELFNKWVGESERAVREVFRKARAAAPSVIFFDEIDALAAERSGGVSQGGGSSVGNRVLAQLLNEMDGVETLEGVTIVAATNRPDMIDKALLRPGRLDRIIYVPLPDEQTRREIFQLQMRKMPVSEDVDPDLLVSKTEGYSGAEVVAVCEEAGLVALSESLDAQVIGAPHFERALEAIQPRTDKELVSFYQKYHSRNSLSQL